jgi:hypothetical protein
MWSPNIGSMSIRCRESNRLDTCLQPQHVLTGCRENSDGNVRSVKWNISTVCDTIYMKKGRVEHDRRDEERSKTYWGRKLKQGVLKNTHSRTQNVEQLEIKNIKNMHFNRMSIEL